MISNWIWNSIVVAFGCACCVGLLLLSSLLGQTTIVIYINVAVRHASLLCITSFFPIWIVVCHHFVLIRLNIQLLYRVLRWSFGLNVYERCCRFFHLGGILIALQRLILTDLSRYCLRSNIHGGRMRIDFVWGSNLTSAIVALQWVGSNWV